MHGSREPIRPSAAAHSTDDQTGPTHIAVTAEQLNTLRQAQLRSITSYSATMVEEFDDFAGVAFLDASQIDNVRTTISVMRTELSALEALL